jgi:lytic murein transglycosylase
MKIGLLLRLSAFFALLLLPAAAQDRAAMEAGFPRWLEEVVRPAARDAGVSDATFEAATRGLTIAWDAPDLITGSGGEQAEFSNPGRYLSASQLEGTASAGRARAATWAETLSRVEATYGVPRGVVVAIWGRESGFGGASIPHSAIRVLATQAFVGTRAEMFMPELIAALRILEEDHLGGEALRASWAGALGQPQFLPSKFLAFAVDFDGDGRRDIWNSVPDTLGSIGSYLQQHGWQRGVGWGVEVEVPESVACSLEGPDQGQPLSAWQAAGVRRVDGGAFEGSGGDTRFLMMPAGRLGPAFLVSENFYVLKRYNESDVYALFVGHLGDRIAGGGAIQGRFQDVSGFSRSDVRRMQQGLVAAGYDVGGADGLVGYKTRIAVGLWQASRGEAETCFPDRALVASFG